MSVKVVLRQPQYREIEVEPRLRVSDLLKRLGLSPETVLVIRGDRLLTRDVCVEEGDTIEIRPVISGGS